MSTIQGFHEFTTQILFLTQHSQTGKIPLTHFTGIGAHERRRRTKKLTVFDGEVQGKVMPLDAPAPGAFGIRLAENAHEVLLWIALGAHSGFGSRIRCFGALDLPEHFFQRHDRRRLGCSTEAQPSVEQCMGQQLLLGCHFLEWQPLALARDEVPVDALFILKGKGRLGLLFRGQHRQQQCRHLGHLFTSLMGLDHRGGGKQCA